MARPSNRAEPGIDTIYALSSGAPPAAIAVVRISGSAAGDTLRALAGDHLPEPRRASYRRLRDASGELLDQALLLWMPGPATATGEDLVELHLHGGRAVVAAVLTALRERGLRLAEPGEFTRRALFNGRLGLSEVEGLADLLAAETESQRREALRRADGMLGRQLDGWMRRLLAIAARIEATIDYDGEEEVAGQADPDIAALAAEIRAALAIPPAERLRDGLRVAIVGPPNAGKSTLFNALVGDEAAIVSATPGTTRDIIERPLSLGGLPIVLLDTAGIRSSDDPIEAAGIARALRQRDTADIILDLSGEVPPADHVLAISAKSDVALPRPGTIAVSAVSGDGLADLHWRLIEIAATLLPREGEVALDRRYREVLADVERELLAAEEQEEALLVAEHIRGARTLLDRLIGGGDVEAMLDALFGRFCLGK